MMDITLTRVRIPCVQLPSPFFTFVGRDLKSTRPESYFRIIRWCFVEDFDATQFESNTETDDRLLRIAKGLKGVVTAFCSFQRRQASHHALSAHRSEISGFSLALTNTSSDRTQTLALSQQGQS